MIDWQNVNMIGKPTVLITWEVPEDKAEKFIDDNITEGNDIHDILRMKNWWHVEIGYPT